MSILPNAIVDSTHTAKKRNDVKQNETAGSLKVFTRMTLL